MSTPPSLSEADPSPNMCLNRVTEGSIFISSADPQLTDKVIHLEGEKRVLAALINLEVNPS